MREQLACSPGLIAVGFLLLVVASASDEGVNESGFIPGVAVGFDAVATEALACSPPIVSTSGYMGEPPLLITARHGLAGGGMHPDRAKALSATERLAETLAGLTLPCMAWFGFMRATYAVTMVVALVAISHFLAWRAMPDSGTPKAHRRGWDSTRGLGDNW